MPSKKEIDIDSSIDNTALPCPKKMIVLLNLKDDDDEDEDEKKWLNKTAGSPIFGFPLRQGLEPR